MAIYVISGAPGTGKTAVINELKKHGILVLEEAARKIAMTDRRFSGKSIKEINLYEFHREILNLQKKTFEIFNARKKKVVFSDRGIIDTIAYMKWNKLKVSGEAIKYVHKFRYNKVFVMGFLDFYETDELRKETEEEQKEIHEAIIETYVGFGYNPVIVPAMPVEERAKFILSRIHDHNFPKSLKTSPNFLKT